MYNRSLGNGSSSGWYSAMIRMASSCGRGGRQGEPTNRAVMSGESPHFDFAPVKWSGWLDTIQRPPLSESGTLPLSYTQENQGNRNPCDDIRPMRSWSPMKPLILARCRCKIPRAKQDAGVCRHTLGRASAPYSLTNWRSTGVSISTRHRLTICRPHQRPRRP